MKMSYELIRKVIEQNNWETANSYGEPGYHLRMDGGFILLGNYNNGSGAKHKRIMNQMEVQGVELEWCDEWVVDWENNGKAYRCEADSYWWRPSWVYTEDGEMLTPDDKFDDWLTWAINDASRALTNEFIGGNVVTKLEEAGFERHDDSGYSFENGWHQGMDDDPKAILKSFQAANDTVECVFVITETSQFYMKFVMYWREAKPTIWISSNHLGLDSQLQDVVDYMLSAIPDKYAEFNQAFPQWAGLVWSPPMSHLDTELNNVDVEFTSWCVDWVEAHTDIVWWEGEPVIMGNEMIRKEVADD